MNRPFPPLELADPLRHPARVVPAMDVWSWALATFLDEASPLYNEEHVHLLAARVGVMWTNVANGRQMRTIIGQAEIPRTIGTWSRARAEQQFEDWFGFQPEFLITLDAVYCADPETDDARFCALVEHEMLHCGHARDAYGHPKFSQESGRPIFAMRGHDAGEFVSIVARYGVGGAAGGVAELVAAAQRAPSIAAVDIAGVCGTCLRKAA